MYLQGFEPSQINFTYPSAMSFLCNALTTVRLNIKTDFFPKKDWSKYLKLSFVVFCKSLSDCSGKMNIKYEKKVTRGALNIKEKCYSFLL